MEPRSSENPQSHTVDMVGNVIQSRGLQARRPPLRYFAVDTFLFHAHAEENTPQSQVFRRVRRRWRDVANPCHRCPYLAQANRLSHSLAASGDRAWLCFWLRRSASSIPKALASFVGKRSHDTVPRAASLVEAAKRVPSYGCCFRQERK